MFILKIENKKGDVLRLTQNEGNYQILDIDGLSPSSASIYTNDIAGYDGARYKSSRLEMRNIVITVKINGDVEANRIALYTIFKTKQWCKIYYSNDTRDVYAEGYVETIECNNFTIAEEMQISIVCPFPYWKDLQIIYNDISKYFALFEFPFSFGAKEATETTPDDETDRAMEFSRFDEYRQAGIVNTGESETGLIFTLIATDTVVNPKIWNLDTAKYMELDCTLLKGDTVVISTVRGDKYIRLYRDLVEINALKYLTLDSEWILLETGTNRLYYEAESGEEYLYIYTEMNTLYEGV